MIFINKRNIPSAFFKIKQAYTNYDELHEKEKTDLKKILIEEQGGLCAYCMSRIELQGATIEHYIPRNGPNGNMSLSLDYRNLFAVCKRTRQKREKEKTCDDRKGDQLLKINPSCESDIRQIKYKMDGTIFSDCQDFNKDLNCTLNLNEPTLQGNRKEAISAVIRELSRRKSGEWNIRYIEKYLSKYSTDSQKREYVGAIIFILQKKLNHLKK